MTIVAHIQRVRHQIGAPLLVGNRRYRLRGYYANRMASDLDHEPHFVALLTRLMRRPGAFIDVGANVGQTLLKVLHIDPTRQYVGFEPQIECCYSINQFLLDNHLTNATILPIALGEKPDLLKLFAGSGVDEMASTVLQSGSRISHIPSLVGDDIIEALAIGDIAAVKIDVEGAELHVLRGLRRTLTRTGVPVVFELLPNFTGTERTPVEKVARDENNERAAGIRRLLSELGYRLFQVDDAGEELPISDFSLDDRVGYVGRDYVVRPA